MRQLRNSCTSAGIALAALALVVGGCGGHSGGGGDKQTDPSTSFKAQANGICRSAYGKLVAATQSLKDPAHPTQTELAALTRTAVELMTTGRAHLQGLTAPASVGDGLETLVGSLQDVIEVAQAKGAAFFAEGATPFSQVDADARAIGLTNCAF